MLYNEVIKIWRDVEKNDLLKKFFPQFVYESNKIENNETRFKDVESIFKEEEVKDFKGNKNTLKEIENQRKLCNNIVELTKENNTKLSIELIKHFHCVLMKECFTEKLIVNGEKPGEFKKGDYVVGIHNIGCSPDEVQENLQSLIDEVNEVQITDKNVLKVVSYFHCWFETIHPFADGNGRVGRMLINYLIIGNNLPPIIISKNDSEEYYLALEYFNLNQEIDKMVKFLDEQAYKTWINFL
ncbi:Fic family protein [Clostridium sp. JS66]|uniref:Fic family protein n=1 Tax=Clostridium sp. JS66 TaxID=3064705 RepID=UPI00298DBE1F|nr:Fic family protein [Clostridium sp. JS66]WPC42377.1 Fic family protein [Clostridium sp. JS66]